MTWIETVASDKARGAVKQVYETYQRQFGFVPNIRRSMSLNPTALRAYVQLSAAVYHGGPLAPEEREMVATVVSATNNCHY